MSTSEATSHGPYYELRVGRIIQETPDACSIVVEVPEEHRETFAYRAGQFLSFRITVGEQRLVRCYSLASSPDTEAEHKVTVKRIDQGRVSNWFNDEVETGQYLEVMKPAGHFCLRDEAGSADRKIVLFGAGSGITPVISIVKSALATTNRPIRLLYANRDHASIIFRDELEALAERHRDRLEVIHRLDDEHGFVDAATAREFVAADTGADFYVCGPGPFMDVVEQALGETAVDADRIFIERFEYPEEDIEDAGEDAPEVGGGVPVTVRLDGKETSLHLGEGETILHAARKAGIDPPFACEEGYCGCCMAFVKEGEATMKLNDGGITPAQERDGWVLTCQAVPGSGGCRVEYPD